MNRNSKKLGRLSSPEYRKNGRISCEPLAEQAPPPFSSCDGSSAVEGTELVAVNPDPSGEALEAMLSSCDADEGRVSRSPRPSSLRCRDCMDLVHELSNVMTGVVVKAQLLDWRLPPYSRLKRPVHEMERNAQRAHELLKSLLRRLGGDLPA